MRTVPAAGPAAGTASPASLRSSKAPVIPMLTHFTPRLAPTGPIRPLLLALGVAALTAGAAGCSAAAQPSSPDSATTAATTSLAPDTADGLGLPIQAYLMTVSQTYELQEAQGILITKCMHGYGFDYVPQYASPHGTTDFDATNMSRRYGISDPATTAKYGYHLPAAPGFAGTDDVASLSDAEYEVLWGHSKTSNSDTVTTTGSGVAIPAGGCMTESRTQAERLAPAAPQAQLSQQVELDSFSQSQSDPRVIAVISAWSKCMAASGYTVASPLAAMGVFGGPPPASQAEITEAKTDLACKASTHLIQTWDAVETQLENQMIAKNQEAFAQILQANQSALKAAAQLLGK